MLMIRREVEELRREVEEEKRGRIEERNRADEEKRKREQLEEEIRKEKEEDEQWIPNSKHKYSDSRMRKEHYRINSRHPQPILLDSR